MKKFVTVGLISLLLVVGVSSASSNTVNNNDFKVPEKSLLLSPEPPVTTIFFHSEKPPVNGWSLPPVGVSFYARDYGWPEPSGVKATYATLYDPDEVIEVELGKIYWYWESGVYRIEYWSEDNVGNVETHKVAWLWLECFSAKYHKNRCLQETIVDRDRCRGSRHFFRGFWSKTIPG
ncbi:MAG TPA: hypothetical protein ENI45_00320 [Thermoplasmatales archaeon]|nr:hypothetical protein [Thermoplasmatales archaeon]